MSGGAEFASTACRAGLSPGLEWPRCRARVQTPVLAQNRAGGCPLRPAGSTGRGTSVPDPATCKPGCRAGPVAAAACSRPSTTTGHARDAGRPGRAHPGGTAPSRGLSGQTPDSGAGRPADQQEGTPSRADLLSSAESSPPLSAVRLAWRPQRRSGGIGSGMQLQDHPTPCRRVARQPRAYPRPGGYRLREQATNPPFGRRKTIPNGRVALSDDQGQSGRTCSACGPFWPCVMSNSTRWFSSRLR